VALADAIKKNRTLTHLWSSPRLLPSQTHHLILRLDGNEINLAAEALVRAIEINGTVSHLMSVT
jgi:hypothetical protein